MRDNVHSVCGGFSNKLKKQMKEAIELIESIKDWLTESDGGNAVTNTDVKYAKEELDQLRTMLENIPSSQVIIESALNAIDDVEYNASSEGCGLEDQGIEDRYESMEHGYQNGIAAAREAVQHSL